jgi:hypothetical protein
LKKYLENTIGKFFSIYKYILKVEIINEIIYRDFLPVKPSEDALNKTDAERLWAISEKWTRLK